MSTEWKLAGGRSACRAWGSACHGTVSGATIADRVPGGSTDLRRAKPLWIWTEPAPPLLCCRWTPGIQCRIVRRVCEWPVETKSPYPSKRSLSGALTWHLSTDRFIAADAGDLLSPVCNRDWRSGWRYRSRRCGRPPTSALTARRKRCQPPNAEHF